MSNQNQKNKNKEWIGERNKQKKITLEKFSTGNTERIPYSQQNTKENENIFQTCFTCKFIYNHFMRTAMNDNDCKCLVIFSK